MWCIITVSFINSICVLQELGLKCDKAVIKVVNFIRSHALKHRQFQHFLSEINAEYGDIT